MEQYIKFILLSYLMLYFLLLLLIPSVIVHKKIGKSPVVMSASDDAHGLIAKYFFIWMVLAAVYVLAFSAFPSVYPCFQPMAYLENNSLRISGLAIMIVSLVWTSAAQINMQASWRVGIDENQKTDLVQTGIFRISRNPIYLGMILSVIGLFMLTPNSFTLLLAVAGYMLVQVQVRLEEDFLYRMHGQVYLDYKHQVRRFI